MNTPTDTFHLESWVQALLADPITKLSTIPDSFSTVRGVIDARVPLKNTDGYEEWAEGQDEYESHAKGDSADVEAYRREIDYDRPVYKHYPMGGTILDVGGDAGTMREFLPDPVKFVSIDPYISAPHEIPNARREAYTCLARPLNFIGACAEFLPFVAESFDWVHMRSMLDHVQVPDIALLEARRVLKPDGRVLIGLYVEGGKSGVISMERRIKDAIKKVFETVGIDRWKDHHVWHPTFKDLVKLIEDNGLTVEDVYWQPYWKDRVCYVCARKT